MKRMKKHSGAILIGVGVAGLVLLVFGSVFQGKRAQEEEVSLESFLERQKGQDEEATPQESPALEFDSGTDAALQASSSGMVEVEVAPVTREE